MLPESFAQKADSNSREKEINCSKKLLLQQVLFNYMHDICWATSAIHVHDIFDKHTLIK